MQVARVGSTEWLYVDSKTAGAALVMLPGAIGTCEMFYKVFAALRAELRVVSVTYPAESDPEALADGLADFMDELGLSRASLVGSSFGGFWAQFFALRYPDRVETLFLGNTFVEPSELFAKNPLFAPETVFNTPPERLQRLWREVVERTPASELRSLQLAMLSGRQSAVNLYARFVGVAEALPCPELRVADSSIAVIDCDDDPIIPRATRVAVRERFPGATVYTLGTGGHYPHVLNPARYVEAIRTQLKAA